MSIANLCRQGETSPYNNIYQFSGKLYDECNDDILDTAENVLSYNNDCLGSSYQTTEQKYAHDNLYQLIKAEGQVSYQETSGSYKSFKSTYQQSFEYDITGNLVKKTSKATELDLKFNQDPLNYTLNYICNPDYAHRLKSINNNLFFLYDLNGNILEMSNESYEPKYDTEIKTFLNEDGEMICTFKYDSKTGGAPLIPRNPTRVNKRFYNEKNMIFKKILECMKADYQAMFDSIYKYDTVSSDGTRYGREVKYKELNITQDPTDLTQETLQLSSLMQRNNCN